jgi:hypothetical protein
VGSSSWLLSAALRLLLVGFFADVSFEFVVSHAVSAKNQRVFVDARQ